MIGVSIGVPTGALLGGGVTGGIVGGVVGAIAAPLLSFFLLFIWRWFASSYVLFQQKQTELIGAQSEVERISKEPKGVRFEITNGEWSEAAVVQLVDSESGKPNACALHLHLALRFHNHDTAASRVTDFRTALWLSGTEEAQQRELWEWELTTPDNRRLGAGDLREEIPARAVTGLYRLNVVGTYPLDVKQKATTDAAFLRLTVTSLGNPDWLLDVPLHTLRH